MQKITSRVNDKFTLGNDIWSEDVRKIFIPKTTFGRDIIYF